jgi:Tol biopolymer transport system component
MMKEQCPSERSLYQDPSTGDKVIQWTNAPCTNQHLYFTSFSVTQDDRWLVFLSDRDGSPNLYAIDRRNGGIRRLSCNQGGLLRSYVYPQGELHGLSKASPCLDPLRNRIYYVRDDVVFCANLDANGPSEREIAKLPAHWYGGYTHISPDGKTFCVPCADPRAFVDNCTTQWEQLQRVPARMQRYGLMTRLYFVDVESGESRIAAKIPFWVTHVQYDPMGSGRMIFNLEGHYEGIGKPLPNRIWCLEADGSFRPLAPERPDEWRSHENWTSDGSGIVYHGGYEGHMFVSVRRWNGDLVSEICLDGIAFHHATSALDEKQLVSDRTDGMISVINPSAERGKQIVDLCRHDTSIETQDAHAHPLITPRGTSIVFTSNRSGNCQVYEVAFEGMKNRKNEG